MAAAADAVVVVVSAPPLEAEPGMRAATKALLYLCLASTWVACAAVGVSRVISRALGLGSPSPVPGALLKTAAGAILFTALLLVSLLLRVITGRGVRTVVKETAASVNEIRDRKVLRELMWAMLRDAAGLALLVCVLFILLQIAGVLVQMGLFPVDRSQRARIGFALWDVGILGYVALFCFIILPNLALKLWKIK